MRALFFLLVLANLLAFAWAQGYWGGKEEGREPERLAGQLNADKLRIVGRDEAPPASPGCRLVSGLALADAQRLGTLVAEPADGLAAKVTPLTEPARYWVHIPALVNKAAADKKAAEIRQLGVTDYHLLQEPDSDRFAISLGLFATEPAATEFLLGLNKKGVRSARIDERDRPPERAELEVRGAADLLAKRLPALISGLPAATVSDCK